MLLAKDFQILIFVNFVCFYLRAVFDGVNNKGTGDIKRGKMKIPQEWAQTVNVYYLKSLKKGCL